MSHPNPTAADSYCLAVSNYHLAVGQLVVAIVAIVAQVVIVLYAYRQGLKAFKVQKTIDRRSATIDEVTKLVGICELDFESMRVYLLFQPSETNYAEAFDKMSQDVQDLRVQFHLNSHIFDEQLNLHAKDFIDDCYRDIINNPFDLNDKEKMGIYDLELGTARRNGAALREELRSLYRDTMDEPKPSAGTDTPRRSGLSRLKFWQHKKAR